MAVFYLLHKIKKYLYGILLVIFVRNFCFYAIFSKPLN